MAGSLSGRPREIAIIGLGGRGGGFAGVIQESAHLAKVVAIAEPRDDIRAQFADRFSLPPHRVFKSWEDFCALPKFCDGVVIATMDRVHAAPAIACLDLGYDVLLEKPMGVTLEECRAIEAAQRRSKTIMGVYHSLRYNKSFRKLKDLVASGAIGRVITVDQLEQVEVVHQSHSFVRANWANESRSSSMLLSKSCHDIDYLCYLVDKPVRAVTSFGSLTYFRREHAPAGSTERCTDGCPVEPTCMYSALKIYMNAGWMAAHGGLSADASMDEKLAALAKSPMSRCVWKCDNDVVDHQVVALQFADDITATFTMTAFTQRGGREIRVHGTLGELRFTEESIELRTFGDNNVAKIHIGAEPGGHGGGDGRVMREWLTALHTRDDSGIVANAQESLRTHSVVFAAERSRREGRMIRLDELA